MFKFYESTLDTGTNDLENHTWTHTKLYSGQVEGAFGWFDKSIDTCNIMAKISGSNCYHESCVHNGLLSNCDTKEKGDGETNSGCGICLVEDESVILCGMNPISLDFVNHDQTCQIFCLDFCDIDSVQDSLFEDILS